MVRTFNPSLRALLFKTLCSAVLITEVPQFLSALTLPSILDRCRPCPSARLYNNPVVSLKVAADNSSNTIGTPKLLLKYPSSAFLVPFHDINRVLLPIVGFLLIDKSNAAVVDLTEH